MIKRTCRGCRALEQFGHESPRCYLGYSHYGFEKLRVVRVRPAEACPKPVTNRAYVDALRKGETK